MTTLETDRLVLRPPLPEDAEALAPMYADPEVMRYLGNGRTLTREETERYLSDQQARRYLGALNRPGDE